MDLLDRVYPAAGGLLRRVDHTLSAVGAAPDHAVWVLLRRVGALPGAAVDAFAATPVAPLAGLGDPILVLAEEFDADQSSVPMPAAWRGATADSYARQWSALSAYLAGNRDTMTGRLIDSVDFLGDIAAWLARGRRALAGVLAECLGSGEAVVVHKMSSDIPSSAEGAAAATIAAEVLGVLAEIIEDGHRIAERWDGLLGEFPYYPPSPTDAQAGSQLGLG